ncbi:MAG: fibronectin type III domain-containing protein, partial [Anaerolineales bacterium]|nr:fibronectin type III domain-containing protein [Anaerolineales bacterium]
MKISRNQFTPSRLLWPCLGAIGLLFLTTLFFNPAPAATAAEPFSCDNVTTSPQTECEALVSLYESTGGYADYSWDWVQDDGWLTAADPCTWYGVGCANGHVTNLSLSNNNLRGSLPTDLNDLTALESFFASGNRLYGEIPAALGELTQLQKLYLQSNWLSGEIPAALGNLSNLIDLYLSRNQLEGEIPAALVNLGTLNVSFSYNMLEASDAAVLAWLAANTPAWANTQTVPPTNLQILNVTNSTVLLSWDPILYTADDGRYIVGIAFASEEGYEGRAVTVDKSTSSLLVTDLPPGKTFYLAVQTITWSHDDQQNTLESRFGEGVTVTTLPGLTCDQITDIPQSECEALYAFYDSTQGWQWYSYTDW